jgi:hypothetical protein
MQRGNAFKALRDDASRAFRESRDSISEDRTAADPLMDQEEGRASGARFAHALSSAPPLLLQAVRCISMQAMLRTSCSDCCLL